MESPYKPCGGVRELAIGKWTSGGHRKFVSVLFLGSGSSSLLQCPIGDPWGNILGYDLGQHPLVTPLIYGGLIIPKEVMEYWVGVLSQR